MIRFGIQSINNIITNLTPFYNDESNWSRNKDVFDARLQVYNNKTEQWLFGAVIGEIGFNTFDHNFGFNSNKKGLYCNFDFDTNSVLLLDCGRGLKDSLLRVCPDIQNDSDAIRIAFTEMISGRAPEQRGNGLKFVLNSIIQNNWQMYYQSGNAVCTADSSGYSFSISELNYSGCLCLLSR